MEYWSTWYIPEPLCRSRDHCLVDFLQEVAAAINQGLIMSERQKQERHAKLFKLVTTHTSHTWAALLVKMLLEQINSQNQARMTPYISKQLLTDAYQRAKKRLFLFDYDVSFFFGTLMATYLFFHFRRARSRRSSNYRAWPCRRVIHLRHWSSSRPIRRT
jgi:hypothetical protein